MSNENAGATNGGGDARGVTTGLGAAGGTLPPQPRYGLADFLVDRDIGCPDCGFTLRGLAGNRCPECGSRIQLVIARPDALWRLRHWLVVACLGHCTVTAMSIATYVSALYNGASLGVLFGSWRTVATFAMLLAVSLTLLAGLVWFVLKRR